MNGRQTHPRTEQVDRSLASIASLLRVPGGRGLDKYLRSRLKATCLDLFRAVVAIADVARLEAGARTEVDYDFAGLRAILDRLAGLGDEHLDPAEVQQAEERRRDLAKVRDWLSITEGQLDEIQPLEIGLRFEMLVDSGLARILQVLRRPSDEIDRLAEAAERQLKKVPTGELQKLWARTSREIQAPDREDAFAPNIPLEPTIVSPEFFAGASPEELPGRISRYLVDYRPRLVRAAARAGVGAVPMAPASLARILAWKPDQVDLSLAERRLVEHVSLVAHLAVERFGVDQDEVSALLGLEGSARVLKGLRNKDIRELVPDEGLADVLLSECQAVLGSLSDLLEGAPEPEFRLLLRYKLAQEVQLPASRQVAAGVREEGLQRRLMAHLIEQGSFVRGTKFGPSETDAVIGPESDPLILEVKLFKTQPAPRQIRKAFVQLRSYMDQSPYRSRGALVLYNLSDVPIVAGRELIGGRIAVVAINLLRKSPSQRETYIEVRPSQDPKEVIDVLPVGTQGRSLAARSKEPARGRRRS